MNIIEDTSLIDSIRNKQTDLRVSDVKMAQILGISRSLYRETQTGSRPVGLTYLISVVHVFPDLIPIVIVFLRDKHASVRNNKGDC
jgi:hypothetical protein